LEDVDDAGDVQSWINPTVGIRNPTIGDMAGAKQLQRGAEAER
jgi:hypothetical protein